MGLILPLHFVVIAKIVINFIPKGWKEIFSLENVELPWKIYPRKSSNDKCKRDAIGSEILGAIIYIFKHFVPSRIAAFFINRARFLKFVKKQEKEDKAVTAVTVCLVNLKWFLIPFPRNECTRFPPFHVYFSLLPLFRSLSLSLSTFLRFEGWRRMSCPLTWRSFMDFQDGFPRKRVNSAR